MHKFTTSKYFLFLQFKWIKELGFEGGDDLRGRFFESSVADALILPGAKLTVIKWNSIDEEVKITKKLKQRLLRTKTYPKHLDDNCCYYCPALVGADIILSVNKKVYFIQCSVAKWKTLSIKKRGFYTTCPENWVPILLMPYDCMDNLKGSSGFAQEFKAKSFSFADANSLLPNDIIEAVYPPE